MLPKNPLLLILIFTLPLLIISCASYNAYPLLDPSPELIMFSSKNEGLTIASKVFNREECRKYLDRDVISEGYQPIQLYFQNDSDNSFIFSLNRISVPIARAEEVAEKVHTSTVGRVVGYGVGALFVWPLIIPAIVDGIGSSDANNSLDQDFAAKTAKDQLIYPHSKLNTIIFVPIHAYQDTLTITLIDSLSAQPKTFQVVSRK